MPHDAFMSWGWRIPFLLSVVMIAIGFYAQAKLEESPAFAQLKTTATPTVKRSPALQVLRSHPKQIILGGTAFAAYIAYFYVLVSYVVQLAPEMERHQVPVEYLANPELAQVLQHAHNAKTPKALEIADAAVKERMFLVGKDGINGPDIGQLRKETTANVNGADEEHFKDPAFVDAAKNLHEAKLLAEGGFKGDKWSTQEQRYERAEKELFARMEGVRREIENRVTGNDSGRLKDQGLKTETAAQAGYGSPEHHEKFAESLGDTGANETQIRGRLAAARSEGTHPSAAVTAGKATKARKSRTAAAVAAERSKSGPAR